jgi:hypothetical protein
MGYHGICTLCAAGTAPPPIFKEDRNIVFSPLDLEFDDETNGAHHTDRCSFDGTSVRKSIVTPVREEDETEANDTDADANGHGKRSRLSRAIDMGKRALGWRPRVLPHEAGRSRVGDDGSAGADGAVPSAGGVERNRANDGAAGAGSSTGGGGRKGRSDDEHSGHDKRGQNEANGWRPGGNESVASRGGDSSGYDDKEKAAREGKFITGGTADGWGTAGYDSSGYYDARNKDSRGGAFRAGTPANGGVRPDTGRMVGAGVGPVYVGARPATTPAKPPAVQDGSARGRANTRAGGARPANAAFKTVVEPSQQANVKLGTVDLLAQIDGDDGGHAPVAYNARGKALQKGGKPPPTMGRKR